MGAGPEEAKMVPGESLLQWGMHSRSQNGNHEGEMSNWKNTDWLGRGPSTNP